MEESMWIRKTVRLKPTPEQEILFRKSAGASRWAYNFFISINDECYKQYVANGKTGQSFIKFKEAQHIIDHEYKPKEEYAWMKEISSQVIHQALRDADYHYRMFFKGKEGHPRFKSRAKGDMSFYVRYYTLKKTPEGFRGERLGIVKTAEPLPDLPEGEKYSDPRIKFDGKYWYLTVAYHINIQNIELTDEILGIDIGIKDTAVCSNGAVFPNINKIDKETKRLTKKLRRERRKLSRMFIANVDHQLPNGKPVLKKPLKDCKNFQKQKKKVTLLFRKLTNIRRNYIHQVTTAIVKMRPEKVQMETLNIAGMFKNKYLAPSLQVCRLGELQREMEYKCQKYGIEFEKVDRWYPSSQRCSRCGHIKHNLHLHDREYYCPECGLKINRDLNAALNLRDYHK